MGEAAILPSTATMQVKIDSKPHVNLPGDNSRERMDFEMQRCSVLKSQNIDVKGEMHYVGFVAR